MFIQVFMTSLSAAISNSWCSQNNIIIGPDEMTYDESIAFCSSRKTILLYAESLNQNCLESILKSSYWINGMRLKQNEEFHHVNSREISDYSKYEKIESSQNKVECAVFNSKTGTWSGGDCSNRKKPICQKPNIKMEIKSWIFSEGDTELMVTNNGDGLESLRKAESTEEVISPLIIVVVSLLILGLCLALFILILPSRIYNCMMRGTIFEDQPKKGYKHIQNV